MRLSPEDLRDLKILKYYRVIRRWVCKQYELKDADLELLIYLDCKGLFKRDDFINGMFTYSWDKHRWERLRRDGWIDVWKERNRKDSKYAMYKTSMKTKLMVNRIYKIMLGQEDIPITRANVFYNNDTYTAKVMNKAIDDMIKDKER